MPGTPDPLCGILTIDKPAEWTSRDAVNRIQRFVRPEKIGHAGTLDPLATGVLVVCVGKATRLINEIHSRPKTYVATFRMGYESDTEDITGNVRPFDNAENTDRSKIESALPDFTGEIEQRPPAYSAVHVDGQRAYDRARKGEEFDIPTKTVQVHQVKVLSCSDNEVEMQIVCGTGTYIRSIGRDLGRQLGCGMVMSKLVRTSVGPFHLKEAISPDEVTEENLRDHLQDPLTAVRHLPTHQCSNFEADRLKNGGAIPLPIGLEQHAMVTLVSRGGKLLALAEPRPKRGELQPRQVFHPQVGS